MHKTLLIIYLLNHTVISNLIKVLQYQIFVIYSNLQSFDKDRTVISNLIKILQYGIVMIYRGLQSFDKGFIQRKKKLT